MSKYNREKMIVEFQKRRKRMLQSFATSMILIALSLAVSQLANSFPLFSGRRQKGLGGICRRSVHFRGHLRPDRFPAVQVSVLQ